MVEVGRAEKSVWSNSTSRMSDQWRNSSIYPRDSGNDIWGPGMGISAVIVSWDSKGKCRTEKGPMVNSFAGSWPKLCDLHSISFKEASIEPENQVGTQDHAHGNPRFL